MLELARRYMGWIFPAPFKDPAWEAEFLDLFREEARHTASYALLAGALVYPAIALALVMDGHSDFTTVLPRLGLAALFLAYAAVLYRYPGWAKRHYTAAAGIVATAGILSLVGLLSASGENRYFVDPARVQLSLVFALFLVYGFTRLPVAVSASIGWVAAIGIVVLESSRAQPSDLVRACVYLGATNLFGMGLARLIEKRERILFARGKGLDEARRFASDALEQKALLLGAVSHEFRQPVTVIAAALEIARFKAIARSDAGLIRSIDRASSSVSELIGSIEEMLVAARYDSGIETSEFIRLDLCAEVERAAAPMRSKAARKGIGLALTVPDGRLLARTDRRGLNRVLTNIIGNAIQYTESTPNRAGHVDITVIVESGSARIRICDNGEGIEPEMLDRMWLPNVQRPPRSGEQRRRLGLGLYVVRRVIDRLTDHQIDVTSTPGLGSVFTVTMPVEATVPYHGASATAPGCLVESTDLSLVDGAYVLLIDDDAAARDAIQDLLEALGVLVCAGGSLAELLSAHDGNDRTVDAIITDFRLGESTTGIDAVRAIREHIGGMPDAMIVTGEADLEPIVTNAPQECVVLRKPVSLADLLPHLARAVARASAQQA